MRVAQCEELTSLGTGPASAGEQSPGPEGFFCPARPRAPGLVNAKQKCPVLCKAKVSA